MPRTYLMALLLAATMAAVQSASPQNTTVAQPNSMSGAGTAYGDTTHETSNINPSMNAGMNAAGNALVNQATPQTKNKNQKFTDPQDPRKSPWWEPRDWDWISKQIGG